jgi:hypothetical protein
MSVDQPLAGLQAFLFPVMQWLSQSSLAIWSAYAVSKPDQISSQIYNDYT